MVKCYGGSRKSKAKKGGCGGGCWSAGSRRKSRGRRLRGGAGWGVGAPINAGALEYKAAYTGGVDTNGTPIPDATDPRGGYTGIGGRRRRKTRRGTRKMRGGAGAAGAIKANAGFTGLGAERGLGGFTDVGAKGPGSNPY